MNTMRLTKMLGLAAIVMAAFMATVGVGSAMATELEEVAWCGKRDEKCAAGQHFPSGTEIFATGFVEFLTSLGNVSCSTSQLNMITEGLLAHGKVTALAFGGCTCGAEVKGTVIAGNLHYLFKGELKANHLDFQIKVTEKAPNGLPKITVECGIINCTYSSKETFIGALLKFTPEILTVLQELAVFEGLFCGTTPVWHGQYTVKCRQNAGSELKNCWVKMES